MTAVERIDATELDPAERRRVNALMRQASRLAASDLVPKELRGKPDNVLAVILFGEQYGLTPAHAVAQLWIIAGRIVPSSQVLTGLAMRAGHRVRIEDSSSTSCTVAIRRREDAADPDGWQRVTFTLDDARQAGLLDEWVETWEGVSSGRPPKRYVIGSRPTAPPPAWAQNLIEVGDVRRKETWHSYPADMLAHAALRRAVKRVAPDVLLGIDDGGDEGLPVEQVLGDAYDTTETEGDTVDAEVVEEEASGAPPAPVVGAGGDVGEDSPPAPTNPDPPAAA